MAKTWVIVVGHAAQTLDVDMNDNVILAFCSNYKFCVTSDNANNFAPALPSGQDFNAGDVWPADGAVSVATTAGTVTWDHQNSGGDCSSAKATGGGHSIQVS